MRYQLDSSMGQQRSLANIFQVLSVAMARSPMARWLTDRRGPRSRPARFRSSTRCAVRTIFIPGSALP
jgi:hypothetical protein